MSIRKKILVGFGTIFAIGLILGVCGLVSTKMLSELSQKQYELQQTSAEISAILDAHYTWRQSLTESVLTETNFTGSLDPNGCALGKWKNTAQAQLITDSAIISLLNQLDEPHNFIHTEAKTIVDKLASKDQAGAKKLLIEELLPKTSEVITILTNIHDRYTSMLNDVSMEIVQKSSFMSVIIIIFIIAAIFLSLLLTALITASIMKPLQKITEGAEMISYGDLRADVAYKVDDEIGKLANSFHKIAVETRKQAEAAKELASGNLTVCIEPRSDFDVMNIALRDMISNLNEMFGQIMNSSIQVSSGSNQIAQGSQALAHGSIQQASAIEQLSSSIAEITVQIKENSDMAARASELAHTIKRSAEKGSAQMNNMTEAVNEIKNASHSINKVIKVIDDIAFQTNILALNAAVEAARAGQHGKGFAVVAEEVRSLAAKSAEAAKDTGSLIANSMEKADLGARIAGETAASLFEIVSGINESSRIAEEIAKSSSEQTNGILQINKGIDQVAQVIQENSAASEQSSSAADHMNEQSNTLKQLVEQFRLKV